MKRKVNNKPYRHLREYYFYFAWQKCQMCNCEFRREKGWAALFDSKVVRYGIEKFICCDCAPTKEYADRFFTEKYTLDISNPPGHIEPKYIPSEPTDRAKPSLIPGIKNK